MFAFILVGYFIGFKLSNNLVPSSYMIEFALGKKILWGLDWSYSYRSDEDNFSQKKENRKSLQKINSLLFNLPFRFYLKEFTPLEKIKTDLLLTVAPNYFFDKNSINEIRDTQNTKIIQKTWLLGINLGFAFDTHLYYKKLPFKLRFYMDFIEAYYSEQIYKYIEIINSMEGKSRRIRKSIGVFIENPLKNKISVYLIFEL